MGSVTFKGKIDFNEIKKVYPIFRRDERLVAISSAEVTVEVGNVTFTLVDTGSHTFLAEFDNPPIITAITVGDEDEAGVNVFVESVTASAVTFRTSAQFTGDVHFHAFEIG